MSRLNQFWHDVGSLLRKLTLPISLDDWSEICYLSWKSDIYNKSRWRQGYGEGQKRNLEIAFFLFARRQKHLQSCVSVHSLSTSWRSDRILRSRKKSPGKVHQFGVLWAHRSQVDVCKFSRKLCFCWYNFYNLEFLL